jgi:hypothetical protein
MWRLAALLVLALGAAPLALVPARPVAVPVAVALVLCAAGLAFRSTPVLAAGIMVALGAYALALAISGGGPRLAGAVGVGVVVALLLDVGDFDARFRRVALGPGVAAAQLRYWVGVAGLGALAAFLLVAAAGVLTGAIALRWTPVVAVIGALTALGAAAVALQRAQRQPETSSERSR